MSPNLCGALLSLFWAVILFASLSKARPQDPEDLNSFLGKRGNPNKSSSQCTAAIQLDRNLVNPPQMRLKQPNVCDPEVRQYSGYLDLDSDKHVFFWYFGSRARLEPNFNPETTKVPLVFWFSGGPGCSSQIANWQENGPCTYIPTTEYPPDITDEARKELPHKVERNPWAWNMIADVVFIDQPIGSGFSYGTPVNSTEQATDTAWLSMQAIHALLTKDMQQDNELGPKEVFLFGESYAGRYIPLFTEYILHMNDLIERSPGLQDRGFTVLNLGGIGIGNGMFDLLTQSLTYYKMGCQSTYPPIFSKKTCNNIQESINPRCQKKLEKCYSLSKFSSVDALRDPDAQCISFIPEPWRNSKECAEADMVCSEALSWSSYVNTYDVRPNARMVPDDYISAVRTKAFSSVVGAEPMIMFTECSDPVFDRFSSTGDSISRSATSSLEYILDRDIPVLLYSGDADFICNWYGTADVVNSLEWKSAADFKNAPTVDWTWPARNGTRINAGELQSASNLSFLRVFGAGHEVPYYKPGASLYMLSQFLFNKKLD